MDRDRNEGRLPHLRNGEVSEESEALPRARKVIPLLSGEAFETFTPESYLEYVRSLYVPPVTTKVTPLADFSCGVNKKGTITIKVRRDPKWLTPDEVQIIATELGLTLQATWQLLPKRKISVRLPERERGKK